MDNGRYQCRNFPSILILFPLLMAARLSCLWYFFELVSGCNGLGCGHHLCEVLLLYRNGLLGNLDGGFTVDARRIQSCHIGSLIWMSMCSKQNENQTLLQSLIDLVRLVADESKHLVDFAGTLQDKLLGQDPRSINSKRYAANARRRRMSGRETQLCTDTVTG